MGGCSTWRPFIWSLCSFLQVCRIMFCLFVSSSHVGSGSVPVDRVNRILCGHCLYYTLPVYLITCIFFHQSIFLISLLFPRLFWCSSSFTIALFKFQSLYYHIFIFFPQNMTVPPHTTLASAILSRLLYAAHVHQLLVVSLIWYCMFFIYAGNKLFLFVCEKKFLFLLSTFFNQSPCIISAWRQSVIKWLLTI